MGEATERFFASLPARAPAVLRSAASGTLQIDLVTDTHTLTRRHPAGSGVRRGR